MTTRQAIERSREALALISEGSAPALVARGLYLPRSRMLDLWRDVHPTEPPPIVRARPGGILRDRASRRSVALLLAAYRRMARRHCELDTAALLQAHRLLRHLAEMYGETEGLDINEAWIIAEAWVDGRLVEERCKACGSHHYWCDEQRGVFGCPYC